MDLDRLPFRYAKKVRAFHPAACGVSLDIEDSDGCLFHQDLQWFSPNVIRMRIYTGESCPNPCGCVSLPMNRETDAPMLAGPDDLRISCGSGYQMAVGLDPYSFSVAGRNAAEIYRENLHDVDPVGSGKDRVPPLGFSRDAEGGDRCVNLCAALGAYEHIWGLGERFTEFDQRGQTVIMENCDALGVRSGRAYKNVPFYVSSNGYGLFVNSGARTQFHIGSRSQESLNMHIPGNCAEIFILLGSYREIVSMYTRMTGPAAAPPEWSFGVWYSNAFMEASQAQVLRDAAEMRAKHIPCDVIHLDCYWMRRDMWCDFEWDRDAFPQPDAMISELHGMHYRICVWVNPYVSEAAPLYREGKQRGFFVRNPSGDPYREDLWHGLLPLCAIVDFTNPDALKWFQEKIAGLLRSGIDAVKTDFGEEIPADARFFDGSTGSQMRNLYAGLFNDAVMRCSVAEKTAENAVVWARSGFIGMQKYPVCWSGDPRSSYAAMAAVLRGGLSLGVSGVPFWSHDIGGFYGPVDPQVFVRWAQFGLLCSHSRFHGTTSRQIWAYGAEAEAIITRFIRLRYRLMPYILKTMRECVDEGLPFIRPMWLEDDASDSALIWDQFYMGRDVVVAPVFGPRDTARTVYVPRGNWVDYFTGACYDGPRTISPACPLDTIPLLMHAGAHIPLSAECPEYLP